MQKSALVFYRIIRRRSVLRILAASALLIVLFVPLVAVSGCGDVEGAASNTAGQTSERAQRNHEVSDILDGLPKNKKP